MIEVIQKLIVCITMGVMVGRFFNIALTVWEIENEK